MFEIGRSPDLVHFMAFPLKTTVALWMKHVNLTVAGTVLDFNKIPF